MESSVAAPPEEDLRIPLTVRDQFMLSTYWFSLNFQSGALFAVVLPTQLLLFVTPGQAGSAQQATFIAWLSALGAIIALVIQPVFGAISDRTTGRMGRRRPYVLAASLIMAGGTVWLAFAQGLTPLVWAFIFVQLANNGATAAYQALIPDLVPMSQRGTASGYMGLMTILGNVGSLALAGVLLATTSQAFDFGALRSGLAVFYIICAIIIVLGAAITVMGVREHPLRRGQMAAGRDAGSRGAWLDRWLDPWRHENFSWVFLTRASVMFGLTLFLTFIEYYFARVAGVQNFVGATAVIAMLALLGAVCSALALGIISDRIGRVPIVCAATTCMALAAAVFMIAPGAPLWPLGLLFGLGYGAYTSVDWALALATLPSLQDSGKDLGLWSLASTIPSILAPIAGGGLIALASNVGQINLGYRGVFALAAIFLVLGAIFVLEVREQPQQPYLKEVRVES